MRLPVTRSLPLPPDDLIALVAGHADRGAFAASRVWSVDKLLEHLAGAGVCASDFRTVLDFGCGCGRVLSGWVLKGAPHEVYGCDVNQRLVSWCAQHLPVKCRVIAAEPPIPYESEFFDLVYGVSVFTHLGLRRQRAWVAELLRIVRPGGHVFMTFHGRRFHERFFGAVEDGETRFRQQRYLILNEEREGSNECATLHEVQFFSELFEPFEVVKHIEGPTHIGGEQDACIFRKRNGTRSSHRPRSGDGANRIEPMPSVSPTDQAPSGPTPTNPWNSDQPADYSAMWIASTECVKRLQYKITGDENMPWLQYAMKTYLAPALGWAEASRPRDRYRCLLLGSNEGHMERTLCENGFRGEVVATDIAEKALAHAKQKSDALGLRNVTHVRKDLNVDPIEGPFDYVIAEGVLHHLVNVERCLRQVESALTDDGLFIMVEFEGAVRFQLPDLQLRWINAALNVLPKALRPFPGDPEAQFPATAQENARVYHPRPAQESVISMEPSDAISGPAVKRLLPEIFEIVERKGFGGTLLAYMTAHFDFKRANQDAFSRAWLKILMDIEDTVIQNGILEDDFVFYAVRRKARVGTI